MGVAQKGPRPSSGRAAEISCRKEVFLEQPPAGTHFYSADARFLGAAHILRCPSRMLGSSPQQRRVAPPQRQPAGPGQRGSRLSDADQQSQVQARPFGVMNRSRAQTRSATARVMAPTSVSGGPVARPGGRRESRRPTANQATAAHFRHTAPKKPLTRAYHVNPC